MCVLNAPAGLGCGGCLFPFVTLKECACVCVRSSTLLCAHSSKSPRPWDREAGTALVQTCSPPHVFLLQDEGRGLHLSLSHPIWLAINIWLQLDPIIRLIHRRGTCSVARMTMRERICIMYGHPPATHTYAHTLLWYSRNPRRSHLPTLPTDTLTNLSVIKLSAYFILVQESPVRDVLSFVKPAHIPNTVYLLDYKFVFCILACKMECFLNPLFLYSQLPYEVTL